MTDYQRRSETVIVTVSAVLQASGTAMLLGAAVGSLIAADLYSRAFVPAHAAAIAVTAAMLGVLTVMHGTYLLPLLASARWAIGMGGTIALTLVAGAIAIYSLESSTATTLAWTALVLGGMQLVATGLVAREHRATPPPGPVYAPPVATRLVIGGVALGLPVPMVLGIVANAAAAASRLP